MSYKGTFRNTHSNKAYYLYIDVNNDSTNYIDITLGENPFVVDVEGGDQIYKPLKLSSATINVVSKDYMFDIYSPTSQSTKVELLNYMGNVA